MVDQVKDILPRIQYTASAAQTVFPYPFPIFDEGDVVVLVDGVTQAIGTDYTVSGVGLEDGGDITFTSGRSSGEIVTIYRDMALNRLTDYQQNGDFLAETVNDDFDRIVLMIQQLNEVDDRSLKFAVQDGGKDTEIDTTQISKLLGLDQNGDLFYYSASSEVETDYRTYQNLASAIADTALAVSDRGRIQGLGDFEVSATNPDSAFYATANGFLKPLQNTYSLWSNPAFQLKVPTDYATLQEAVDAAFEQYLGKGNGVEILIESGHSPATGIYVEHGDYSGITISSVDPAVTVDAGFGASNTFIEGKNARMPVLNCLVSGNAGAMGFGYKCHNGSVGYITAGNGVKDCWQDGLAVRYGSFCYADGTIWTGNALNATTSSGIVSWSSVVHAEGADVSNSGYYEGQAAHGGILNMQNGIANNTGRYGIRASDGATANFDGGTANGNAVYGVYGFNGCSVNARGVTATGNGTANLVATNGVLFCARDAVATGSLGAGAICSGASMMALTGANLSGAAANGIEARASSVDAGSANCSNCAGSGILAQNSAKVNFESGNASNAGASGVAADDGSFVNADGATMDDCTTYGARAWYGSEISMRNAFARRAGTRGLYAFSGSKITAKGVNARTADGVDNTNDFVVLEGSVIVKHGGTGGVSKAINTVTTDGIIYG